jgi:hypothetical protein
MSDALRTEVQSFLQSILADPSITARLTPHTSSATMLAAVPPHPQAQPQIQPLPPPPPLSQTQLPLQQAATRHIHHRSKRDTVNISDSDSDSEEETDLEDRSSTKDTTSKYVDSCLKTLRARNITLSQHVDEYGTKVGWNNKRHRHEATEVARIYDATMTESMTQIKRRLIARYAALEEFDFTGNTEVFEHIQGSGYSLIGNNIKHQLHRAVKRSAINTVVTVQATQKGQHTQQQHTNKNFNNNQNHHNNNNNKNNHNNGGGGGGGRGNNHRNKSTPNGQGAVKNDGAGQQ